MERDVKMAKNMKVNSKNDLTEGPIFGKLIGFAIPVILGNLCFQLYNVVDSIVVGNYVGTDALAAVGAVFPIMMSSVRPSAQKMRRVFGP